MIDPIPGATVMKTILTIIGPTPDQSLRNERLSQCRARVVHQHGRDRCPQQMRDRQQRGRQPLRLGLHDQQLDRPDQSEYRDRRALHADLIGPDGKVYGINASVLFAMRPVNREPETGPWDHPQAWSAVGAGSISSLGTREQLATSNHGYPGDDMRPRFRVPGRIGGERSDRCRILGRSLEHNLPLEKVGCEWVSLAAVDGDLLDLAVIGRGPTDH